MPTLFIVDRMALKILTVWQVVQLQQSFLRMLPWASPLHAGMGMHSPDANRSVPSVCAGAWKGQRPSLTNLTLMPLMSW